MRSVPRQRARAASARVLLAVGVRQACVPYHGDVSAPQARTHRTLVGVRLTCVPYHGGVCGRWSRAHSSLEGVAAPGMRPMPSRPARCPAHARRPCAGTPLACDLCPCHAHPRCRARVPWRPRARARAV
eukprot:4914982-Pleurochrysis_carterae.AAC.4